MLTCAEIPKPTAQAHGRQSALPGRGPARLEALQQLLGRPVATQLLLSQPDLLFSPVVTMEERVQELVSMAREGGGEGLGGSRTSAGVG